MEITKLIILTNVHVYISLSRSLLSASFTHTHMLTPVQLCSSFRSVFLVPIQLCIYSEYSFSEVNWILSCVRILISYFRHRKKNLKFRNEKIDIKQLIQFNRTERLLCKRTYIERTKKTHSTKYEIPSVMCSIWKKKKCLKRFLDISALILKPKIRKQTTQTHSRQLVATKFFGFFFLFHFDFNFGIYFHKCLLNVIDRLRAHVKLKCTF